MSTFKAISYREASRCEWGLSKKGCRHCIGRLYGKQRIKPGALLLEFSELPTNDPHYVSPGPGHKGQRVLPGWTASLASKTVIGPINVPLIGGQVITVPLESFRRRK